MNYYFSICMTGDARQDRGGHGPSSGELGRGEEGSREGMLGQGSWAWSLPSKSQWESRWQERGVPGLLAAGGTTLEMETNAALCPLGLCPGLHAHREWTLPRPL